MWKSGSRGSMRKWCTGWRLMITCSGGGNRIFSRVRLSSSKKCLRAFLFLILQPVLAEFFLFWKILLQRQPAGIAQKLCFGTLVSAYGTRNLYSRISRKRMRLPEEALILLRHFGFF